ncbi:MAG: hypothetical protein HYV09_03320 [Deltaproteobacteria bacterium]|nr:hypothetical protein [Deltaproteobacteria bacterium]
MQVDLTPQVVVTAIGVGLALQTAVITVAIMIRGTAKDLARESAAREQAEKATEARLLVVERELHKHDVELHGLGLRVDANERDIIAAATTTAQHAQTLAALGPSRSDDRRRR